MKYSTPLFFTAAIALLSGCSSLKVTSEEVADFDYSKVKTYQWVEAPSKIIEEDDTYLNENVQKALNNDLSKRGWKQVLESEKADLQVVYYIKLAEHEEYTTTVSDQESQVTGGFTYDKNKNGWGYKDQESDLNVYRIEIGTLRFLIYDNATGNKIWSGTLQTRLDRTTPLDQQPALLAKIADKIISRIPAK